MFKLGNDIKKCSGISKEVVIGILEAAEYENIFDILVEKTENSCLMLTKTWCNTNIKKISVDNEGNIELIENFGEKNQCSQKLEYDEDLDYNDIIKHIRQ